MVAQIETKEGVQNMEEIAAVDGLGRSLWSMVWIIVYPRMIIGTYHLTTDIL